MEIVSVICVSCLIALILYVFLKGILGKNKAFIWSPLTTIALTYLYYCVVPYFYSIEQYAVDETAYRGYLFHFAALLSFISILVGFHFGPSFSMKKWNSLFVEENTDRFALILLFVALVGYVPFRGLHLTFTSGAEESSTQLMTGGIIYYLIFLIDILAASTVLLLIRRGKFKYWRLLPLWVILSTMLFAGARWRIIVTVVASLTMFHLYPVRRKPNYLFIVGLMVILFLGFSIMDKSRQRGQGINMEKAQALQFDDIKSGAGENYSVYMFSLVSMDCIESTSMRCYFEPIVSAALMPIPRAIFPSKPNAEYIHELELATLGDDNGGAAFLNFVEGYLSFGWFGVILYGLVIGFLAKGVWMNYWNNKDSIGAILLLGLYSGVTYCLISRGYLPGNVNTAVYVICLPFWISSLIAKKKKSTED